MAQVARVCRELLALLKILSILPPSPLPKEKTPLGVNQRGFFE